MFKMSKEEIKRIFKYGGYESAICKHIDLSEDIIREFADDVNWYHISEYQKLSDDFIRKNINKLFPNVLLLRKDLSMSDDTRKIVIDANNRFDEFFHKRHEGLSIADIREYEDIITPSDWTTIFTELDLPEDFIREFEDKLDWYAISAHQKLSEKFIRKFAGKVDWNGISSFQNLSGDFIEEFSNRINWELLSLNKNVSEEIIAKFPDKFDWHYISRKDNLSLDFIRKFKDKLNWVTISKRYSLTESLFIEFEDRIDWTTALIKSRQNLSDDFIISHQDKFDWIHISYEYRAAMQRMPDEIKNKYANINNFFKIAEKEFIDSFDETDEEWG